MSRHRFEDLVHSEPAGSAASLPAAASGFVACPMVLQSSAWAWQDVYRRAYDEARTVVRPSRLERWLTASLN